MESLFLKLVNMSISASWVVLAVVVLRFVFRSAPKGFRCVLWALVAVRLLCPFSIQSSLSIMPRERTIESPAVSSTVQVSTGGNGTAVATDDSLDYNYTYDTPVQSAEAEPAEDPVTGAPDNTDISVPESSGTDISLTQVLPVVWLCGVAALLGYSIVSFLRLKKKVSASIRLGDGLYICDYVESPFILGIFKPRIYLPSDLEEERRVYVIAHESAHLKRKDNLIKLTGFVLLAVYWFNPVIWLAYILLCRDIELACDERVIRDMGAEDKRAYSEALLSCSVPRKMILACPVAFGEVGVKERVKSVLNYKKPAFWVLIVAVLACIAAAVCLLTNPLEESGTTDNVKKDYSIQGVYFTYDDVQYDLTEQEQLVNAATATYEVGDYIVVECNVNTDNNYYAVFDTAAERFVNGFAGTNLIWEEDNIYTAVYSLWNEIYDYSGNLISSVNLTDGAYIARLEFEENAELMGKSSILATVFDGETYSLNYVYYYTGAESILGGNGALFLPDSWAGRYEAEYGTNGMLKNVYVKSIHEENEAGLLFYISTWNGTLTKEEASQNGEWSSVGDIYLWSEYGVTYFICYPDDIQYDVTDSEQQIEYETMSGQIDKIGIGRPSSSYAGAELTVDVQTDGTYVYGLDITADTLEQAISNSVLRRYNNAFNTAEGLNITAEDHLIYAEEVTGKYVTEYMFAVVISCNIGDEITENGACEVPTVLTFYVNDDGSYTLTEYWEASDGNNYEGSVQKKYPADIAGEIMSSVDYQEQHAACRQNIEVSILFRNYFNTAMESMSEAARMYEYFENEENRELALNSLQDNYIINYRPLALEKLNSDLYVYEISVYTSDMVADTGDMFRTVYIFAGKIDGELYIIRSAEDIPESLRGDVDLSIYDGDYKL